MTVGGFFDTLWGAVFGTPFVNLWFMEMGFLQLKSANLYEKEKEYLILGDEKIMI